MKSDAASLSIVIPDYRSGGTLPHALASVRSQVSASAEWGIYVSSSGPEEIMDAGPITYPILRSIDRLFAGAARNRGAQESNSAWICFLDADCVWNSTWKARAEELMHEHPEIVAFNGAVFYEAPANTWDFALHLLEFHEFLSKGRRRLRFLHSGNLLIRRDFFDRVGGFREDIPMCTDFTFASHLVDNPMTETLYDPQLSITHLKHLTDEKKIRSKVRRMGYWRARVDRDLPPRLSLHHRFYFPLVKEFMAEAFFLTILVRAIVLNAHYLPWFLLLSPKIYSLAKEWAWGFCYYDQSPLEEPNEELLSEGRA